MARRRKQDYRYGGPSESFARIRLWSITTWLVAINVLVFLVDMFVGKPVGLAQDGSVIAVPFLQYFGEFRIDKFLHGQVWRLLSFQFLHDHASAFHLLFNMIGLGVFGPMVESFLGRRKYLAYYLICGIAGPLMYFLLAMLGRLEVHAGTPLIGASAGLFGVLVGSAIVAPGKTVMLLFPPMPIQIKTLALIFIGIAIGTVISRGMNAGGEAAHLGGAAMGWLLISKPHLLDWAQWLPVPHRRRPKYMKYRPE